MCDFDKLEEKLEKRREERRQKREEEKNKFSKKVVDKIRDGELIYQSLALFTAKRYNLDTDYNIPNPVYIILNHYFNEDIEEDFKVWLNKENSPLIREARELKKIFPEIYELTQKEREIVEIANQLYGLNLQYYKEIYEVPYIYSFEFDFNSFVPIDTSEITELQKEIAVLSKYGHNTTELEEKLKTISREYNLNEKQLKLLIGDEK